MSIVNSVIIIIISNFAIMSLFTTLGSYLLKSTRFGSLKFPQELYF